MTTALSLEGVRAIAASLPRVMAEPGDLDGAVAAAVRRVPVGRRPRHHVGRVAPQDHPRAGRHVQPRARRCALRRAAARRRLQRARPADGDGAPRRRARNAWRGSGGDLVGPGDGIERPDLARRARPRARSARRSGVVCGGRDHRQPAAGGRRRHARPAGAGVRRSTSDGRREGSQP